MRISPQLARIIEGNGEPENNIEVNFEKRDLYSHSSEKNQPTDWEYSDRFLLIFELIKEILGFKRLRINVFIDSDSVVTLQFKFYFYFHETEIRVESKLSFIELLHLSAPRLFNHIKDVLLSALRRSEENFDQTWVISPDGDEIRITLFSLGNILRFNAESTSFNRLSSEEFMISGEIARRATVSGSTFNIPNLTNPQIDVGLWRINYDRIVDVGIGRVPLFAEFNHADRYMESCALRTGIRHSLSLTLHPSRYECLGRTWIIKTNRAGVPMPGSRGFSRQSPTGFTGIGNSECKFNARSTHLRCAVNPSGPCEGCEHFAEVV